MFAGSLVALVTPMSAGGEVDFEAWARLLDFHAAHGTQGVVVGGTTGESATLRDAELRELVVRACAQLRGRLVVIAGAGGRMGRTLIHAIAATKGVALSGAAEAADTDVTFVPSTGCGPGISGRGKAGLAIPVNPSRRVLQRC